MDDSVITYDKIIEETKTVPTKFNGKKVACKTQNFYMLLAFLFITIALLIALVFYCCLTKYRVKPKYLLPFHITNYKLKQVIDL